MTHLGIVVSTRAHDRDHRVGFQLPIVPPQDIEQVTLNCPYVIGPLAGLALTYCSLVWYCRLRAVALAGSVSTVLPMIRSSQTSLIKAITVMEEVEASKRRWDYNDGQTHITEESLRSLQAQPLLTGAELETGGTDLYFVRDKRGMQKRRQV